MRTPPHPTRHSPPRGAPNRRDAFTLLELVAVIGIMLMMTLVVVGSYVGITRAIAARAGINQMRNAVMLTRQHACTDGQRTYLYVLNESEFVICRRAGRVSSDPVAVNDDVLNRTVYSFEDYYTDLDSYVNAFNQETDGLMVYDFDSTDERPYAKIGRLESRGVRGGWYVKLDRVPRAMDPTDFKTGHVYGIELYSKRKLPRGYTFIDPPYTIYFEPNGASEPSTKIEIVETISPTLVQSVSVQNGRIVVEAAGTP